MASMNFLLEGTKLSQYVTAHGQNTVLQKALADMDLLFWKTLNLLNNTS